MGRARPQGAVTRLCVRYLEAARRRFPQSNGLSNPFYTFYAAGSRVSKKVVLPAPFYTLYMFYTAKPPSALFASFSSAM